MRAFGQYSNKVENKNCVTCQWEVLKSADLRLSKNITAWKVWCLYYDELHNV